MMDYDKNQAQNLLRQEPNMLRWHDRAHAVRTHEYCQMSPAHIELVIARALEQAYQDGKRDGSLDERKSALRSLISQCEGIESQMHNRTVEIRKELSDLADAKPTFPGRR